MKGVTNLTRGLIAVQLGLGLVFPLTPALAQSGSFYKVLVNSNQDGEIQPDEGLTLREAIALTNGTLSLTDLSPAEQAQVTPASQTSTIEFSLLPGSTTIELQSQLPPLTRAGLLLDATTQPGSDIDVGVPRVVLTPALDREVIRGLTIAADDITVRGFSLYGFTKSHRYTASTPPADIFIVHQFLPENYRQKKALKSSEFKLKNRSDQAPEGIVIEQNWLGMTPEGQMPERLSAFGVSVFNSNGATIRQNRIAHHEGSAIITGDRATNLVIKENEIIGNGLAGMPDAIRLEGQIDNGVIRDNLICGNDGSAVFLFKPKGSVAITDNNIKFNGQRLRRSAIYLMGNDHQVRNNRIRYQTGPGVTVAAHPQSDRNLITNNRFGDLEGLSIDLVTRRHTGVSTYQRGDGVNPAQRDSGSRRRDTANRAIQTPEFLSQEFIRFGQTVGIDGIAEPGATVDFYRVQESGQPYGPLSQPLTTVMADEEGRFAATLTALEPGDWISAIATHPDYGTSEPALNAVIRTIDDVAPAPLDRASVSPNCDSKTIDVSVQPPPIIPAAVSAKIPRVVHFALDQDSLSAASLEMLDQVAEMLRQYPSIRVDLQGHTDSRASAIYNQDLAQRRALAVRRYLLQQGIDPARMTIRAWGETQLLTAEGDRIEYARNRRVELVYRDSQGVNLVVVDQENDLQIEP